MRRRVEATAPLLIHLYSPSNDLKNSIADGERTTPILPPGHRSRLWMPGSGGCVYYARKSEEWRIRAWKLISAASRKSGWNDDFERLGMLYGYEEWQIEWWIAHRRGRKIFDTPDVAQF
jgi:hypothetical protein